MKSHGFSLVEASISITIFAIVLGTVSAGLVRDTSAQEVISAHVGPEMKVRNVLHRIGTDLRMASVWGEDLDHNAVRSLEAGEDLNGNGVLDADWDLPDNSNTTDLSFNTREDLRDNAGKVIANGVYSGRKRYFLDKGSVVREVTTYVGVTPTTTRSYLARGVKSLVFTRVGGLIRVRAVVDVATSRRSTRESVIETRVWLRN